MRNFIPFFSIIAFLNGVVVTCAWAEDPPERVGRISYIEGAVSFHGTQDTQWSYANLNYPVISGNSIWTEPNGRSEVQVDSVDIRMDHSTEMQVVQLDDSVTRLNVPQGIVNIQFSEPPVNGSVEVVTPVGSIELTHPGTYHIDSGRPDAPHVQVTTLEGQLDIEGPQSRVSLVAGETAVMGTNPPSFSLVEGNPTAFDDWALLREKREAAHYAAQYVSPHITGYEDLDNYGQWEQNPDYGAVWYPAVAQADWAPYSYGHWAFVGPWGWTWIDDAPWGFAPFHYGRWTRLHERWAWVPGHVERKPVYAPALVAFVGEKDVRARSKDHSPALGWVPLGPREIFHPYYPSSERYMHNINRININRTNVSQISIAQVGGTKATGNHIVIMGQKVTGSSYANQASATIVSTTAFQQGRPVHASRMDVRNAELTNKPVTPALSPRDRQAGQSALVVPVPGPQMHPEQEHAIIPKPVYFSSRPQAIQAQNRAEEPAAQKTEITHPEQHSHIAATPQGWQRGPQQHKPEQHAPQPHGELHHGSVEHNEHHGGPM